MACLECMGVIEEECYRREMSADQLISDGWLGSTTEPVQLPDNKMWR